jgi:hypothetical protein
MPYRDTRWKKLGSVVSSPVAAVDACEGNPIAYLALNSSKDSSACSPRRGIEVLKARTIRGWAAGRAAARKKLVEPRAATRSMEEDGIVGGLAEEDLVGRMRLLSTLVMWNSKGGCAFFDSWLLAAGVRKQMG